MSSPPPRVVVLGAGVAALETAFQLESRLAGRIRLTLVHSGDLFVLRPNLVYVPFGADVEASSLRIPEVLERTAIEPVHATVESVDPDAGRVQLAGGHRLPYEHLVIATGAAARPGDAPGLAEHAVSIGDTTGSLRLRQAFERTRGRAREGVAQRVLFVVPAGNRWSLPLYEVALMFETWLRREHAREPVELAFVTHETAFAEAGGPRLHDLVADEFAERDIDGCAGARLTAVGEHRARFAGGREDPFDLLVTVPPHGPAVHYAGLPLDEHGFVRVEGPTRQVVGHPELYAPGGAGDFPLKDEFLALVQAEAVASHLASVVAGGRFKRPFDAVSVQIVDMLDRAAFAQLPLELTGDAEHPVRLRSGGSADYKVGVSPLWRGAKRMLASYLLMRFAAGEPFEAGAGWRMLDFGMRAMAGMLAEPARPDRPQLAGADR